MNKAFDRKSNFLFSSFLVYFLKRFFQIRTRVKDQRGETRLLFSEFSKRKRTVRIELHLTSKKTLQHSTHSVLFKGPKRFSSLGSSLGIAAVSWPFHVRTKKGTILSRNESGVRTQVRIRVVIRTASFAFIVHATRDRALLAQSHRRFRHFKFTICHFARSVFVSRMLRSPNVGRVCKWSRC